MSKSFYLFKINLFIYSGIIHVFQPFANKSTLFQKELTYLDLRYFFKHNSFFNILSINNLFAANGILHHSCLEELIIHNQNQ